MPVPCGTGIYSLPVKYGTYHKRSIERSAAHLNFLKRLFKQTEQKPRAIAFVDYEYWYYACKNQFGGKPNVLAWRQQLDETYILDDILVFAEFNQQDISNDLSILRNITNTIIETYQPNGYHKKDMTDFIMLDYIYQTAISRPEINTYILFTGDGHFHSAVKYLSQRLKKKVIVYGASGSISKQLRTVAAKCIEVPDAQYTTDQYRRMIVRNMEYVAAHPGIIPTFNGIVSAVSRRNNVSEDSVRAVLQRMLDEKLLIREIRHISPNQPVKIIAADWDALVKAGL